MMTFFDICRLFCLFGVCSLLTSGFNLTILHTNDLHSEFEQFNINGIQCSENTQEECYGGVARRHTAVQRIRNREQNVLLLDAGDVFQGSTWFDVYKGRANAHFMNLLGYDAMTLGNHEFDNGIEGLLPFLESVNFPVLSSNIDATMEPALERLILKRVVMDVGGESVGLIGYITTMAPHLTKTGNLTFKDEATALQREVDQLLAAGVNKIIAIGHAGYGVDMDIARAVSGIDVIVGGHTTVFLYTGPPPSNDHPGGPYPTIIQSEADPSHKTLIVTAYSYGKYLGLLRVNFDEAGAVIAYGGNPILLYSSIAEDPEVLLEISKWRIQVTSYRPEVIGQSYVFLPGKFCYCEEKECGLGDLITDALIWRTIENRRSRGWSDVGVAMLNSGSIRNSLNIGNITAQDADRVTPFHSTIVKIELTGRHLLEVLEQSMKPYGSFYQQGGFLQVSGLLVEFNLSQPLGSKVSSVFVRCTECLQPTYEPLQMEEVYPIAITSFLANGGDGLSVFSEHSLSQNDTGVLVKDAVKDYIKARSPIIQGIERRIVLTTQDDIW